MFRYRITFRKEGPARWIGHLDLVRLFEQACRRAGLPLAYSEGFNPRPRLVFAAPLPVGVAGLRELVDAYLRVPMAPELVQARLRPVLPEGLAVVRVKRVPREEANLMAVVRRAAYRAEGRPAAGLCEAALTEAVRRVLQAGEIKSVRQGKKGPKERDIRPGIFALDASFEEGKIVVTMLVQAGQEGNVRPEEVMAILWQLGSLPGAPEDFDYYRTGLYTVAGDRTVSLG
ncbi:TIGR03936 family radical SAM-associated protein [Thermodesulfitimonas autotrophica]|uniref:TIGR03936 family radical SAM-associated protein n=1 Tax=Thermodesulfitimonas autotrophica TaxID=1894989 RepID=UPI002FE270CA